MNLNTRFYLYFIHLLYPSSAPNLPLYSSYPLSAHLLFVLFPLRLLFPSSLRCSSVCPPFVLNFSSFTLFLCFYITPPSVCLHSIHIHSIYCHPKLTSVLCFLFLDTYLLYLFVFCLFLSFHSSFSCHVLCQCLEMLWASFLPIFFTLFLRHLFP